MKAVLKNIVFIIAGIMILVWGIAFLGMHGSRLYYVLLVVAIMTVLLHLIGRSAPKKKKATNKLINK